MPEINVNVRQKIARTVGAQEIVCGNSDYVVKFDLDAEWATFEAKTAHCVWMDLKTGKMRYCDVPFAGDTAELPAIYNAHRVEIGVYAGDIRTTTPAVVPCARCITDGAESHEEPSPDIYEQLLEMLEKLAKPVGFGATGDATFQVDGLNMSITGIAEYDMTVVNLLTEPYASSLENAYCNDDTGAVVTPYSTRVCCTEFIDVPDGATKFKVDVTISGSSGRAYEYLYDANGGYLKSATSGNDPITGAAYWTHQASGTIRAIPSTCKKMRILCRTSGGGNISPSDIGLFKVAFW